MGRSDRREGAEVSEAELAQARIAFRGSQESARAWRAFSPNSKHHDVTYWSMLTSLFVEPGLNRMTLIDRITDQAGVSRSTAERAIREAKAAGYIVDRPVGKEVRYSLSEALSEHCMDFYRNFMDLQRIIKRFGFDNKQFAKIP